MPKGSDYDEFFYIQQIRGHATYCFQIQSGEAVAYCNYCNENIIFIPIFSLPDEGKENDCIMEREEDLSKQQGPSKVRTVYTRWPSTLEGRKESAAA